MNSEDEIVRQYGYRNARKHYLTAKGQKRSFILTEIWGLGIVSLAIAPNSTKSVSDILKYGGWGTAFGAPLTSIFNRGKFRKKMDENSAAIDRINKSL